MKILKIQIQKAGWQKGFAGLALGAILFCMSAFHVYAAEGTVIAETAKIRAQTSTTSEVVGSTQKGKKIDILEAVKDSAGTVWYKVSVTNGGYGYIRSDLVQTSENIPVSSSASGSGSSSGGGGTPAETTPTSIGEQAAVIKSGSNANVRSGASTQHSTVAALPNGTAVTLIGEANDNAGNKWYQIRCDYNGKAVEGYVRSDLVEISEGGSPEGESPEGGEGENPEGTEGENPEGESPEGGEGESPEPAPEEHNDYEVVYAADDVGEYEYWLYVNTGEGGRIRINELLTAASTANENIEKMQKQVDQEKIIIIILAVVIVLLIIVLTILLFKIRSLYYEDYDEEEDEEEEEEPEPVRKKVKRRPVEEEEEAPPVRKKRPVPSEERERPSRSQEKGKTSRAREDRELYAAERKEPVKKAPARKPQNFLVDDDEFEFEFLNMDDKDL